MNAQSMLFRAAICIFFITIKLTVTTAAPRDHIRRHHRGEPAASHNAQLDGQILRNALIQGSSDSLRIEYNTEQKRYIMKRLHEYLFAEVADSHLLDSSAASNENSESEMIYSRRRRRRRNVSDIPVQLENDILSKVQRCLESGCATLPTSSLNDMTQLG